MSHQLKAGGLGSANHTGTPPEFASSMAQRMEEALNDLLVGEGRDPVSTENTTTTRDRRILFVAIAQGVVQHLLDNPHAFDVEHNDGTLVSDRRIRITGVAS